MKSYKLLLSLDLIPAAERMFSSLGSEFTVVDPAPIWREQNRRQVQVDLTDFQALVFARLAQREEVVVEILLKSWIERYSKENGGKEQPDPARTHGISGRLRLIAEWSRLGYTGREEAVRELIARLA
jgi:hypothetical protein